MATLANILGRVSAAREEQEAIRVPAHNAGQWSALRAIPNEDVFLFVKNIDNSGVVRVADPKAGRACWKMIGAGIAVAVLLVMLLLPSLYSMLAGYRLEALRQEHNQLRNESAALDLEEAKLLSPERLNELAKRQQMVDPAPQAVIYLEGKTEGVLARR